MTACDQGIAGLPGDQGLEDQGRDWVGHRDQAEDHPDWIRYLLEALLILSRDGAWPGPALEPGGHIEAGKPVLQRLVGYRAQTRLGDGVCRQLLRVIGHLRRGVRDEGVDGL